MIFLGFYILHSTDLKETRPTKTQKVSASPFTITNILLAVDSLTPTSCKLKL